ncbi:DUF547 domain-containing protein [Marinobacter xestospongiae]|uniref:DUF547 domain-containing protein n=1 Tax=Marinobacter xestospongiae TaxID=994319 RepID=A0ABU3W0F3_9GAMM|nr:DUF547 domain-containing protein [Marinobacter xestospongiae]MDV2080020.1 DUF547 domain-containing protein [Marinobacter xestospongiae]
MGYRQILLLLTVLLAWPAVSTADVNAKVYRQYQALLSDHLVEKTLPENGLVSAFDYDAALAGEGLMERLSAQEQALREFNPGELEGREASVAFWINAYNFFMLAQILSEQPEGALVSSVWDYGGRLNPFVDNVFERQRFNVGGQNYSLNDIEKGILLGQAYADKGWKDARVHFAVNCASVGCPPLRARVYTADNLETLLAENTRRAFNTGRHLRVEGDTLYLTELFKWYEDDFTQAAGSEQAFISQWATPAVAEAVKQTESIRYIDYDWRLNRPENFGALQ